MFSVEHCLQVPLRFAEIFCGTFANDPLKFIGYVLQLSGLVVKLIRSIPTPG